MSDNEIKQYQDTEEQANNLDMKAIWHLFIGKWKWFVASVIVCVALGAYYLLKTPKQYSRSAIVLIKDESKQQGIGSDISSMFSNLGYSMGQTNVNNELYDIQAPSVIWEAGHRLGLDVTYIVPGTFHDNELYGNTLPVTVRFLGLTDDQTASFKLELSANGKVKMSKFYYDGDPVGEKDKVVEGYTKSIINTPVGRVVITPTKYFGSYMAEDNLPISVYKSTLYQMTTNMQSRLSAALADKQASIINMSYTDEIPDRACDVINMIISVYKEQWVKDKNQVIDATSKFINNRIAIIERELGGLDANISSYRSQHLIPDEEATSTLYMDQTKDISKQLLDLNTQRAMAIYVRNMLVRSSKDHYQLLPVNSGIESSAIEKQISTYNTYLMQRNQLMSNSSSTNPIVEDYDNQLAGMRRSIVTGLNNLVAGIDQQVSMAQSDANQTKSRIASAPGQIKYLQSVGRQQKVKEQLYIFLLQKREENELSQAFTAYNVRLVSPPYGSFIPVSPKSKQILIIAFLLGLIIPGSIIFLNESMDTRLRGRKDLDGLDVPFAGEIPYANKLKWYERITPKRMEKDSLKIVVAEGNHDIMNESFRVLRTKLEFLIPANRDSNVVQVTSFNPNSGKTFLTANIGAALAVKKKRVLIIDCDLRKASISTLVHSPHKGITHYLTGKDVNLDDLLYKVDGFDTLTIMPVGVMPPNPPSC